MFRQVSAPRTIYQEASRLIFSIVGRCLADVLENACDLSVEDGAVQKRAPVLAIVAEA